MYIGYNFNIAIKKLATVLFPILCNMYCFGETFMEKMGFPGGSAVKNLAAMKELQEMRVRSLGWEDPLEEDLATPSSVLAWRIPWTEEPGGLQSIGLQRVRHNLSDLAHSMDSKGMERDQSSPS